MSCFDLCIHIVERVNQANYKSIISPIYYGKHMYNIFFNQLKIYTVLLTVVTL